MSTVKELHDGILAKAPKGFEHDASSCTYCKEVASQQEDKVSENKIYDQETVDALLTAKVEEAVAAASAKLTSELEEFRTGNAELTSKLEERDEEVSKLKEDIEKREEASRLEELADARAAKMKEADVFSDEQIEERKLDWAALEEDAFDGLLKDYTIVLETAAKHQKKTPSTKLDGTRETAGDEGSEANAVHAFFDTL